MENCAGSIAASARKSRSGSVLNGKEEALGLIGWMFVLTLCAAFLLNNFIELIENIRNTNKWSIANRRIQQMQTDKGVI